MPASSFSVASSLLYMPRHLDRELKTCSLGAPENSSHLGESGSQACPQQGIYKHETR